MKNRKTLPALVAALELGTIKAHEATGHTTMYEHEMKMKRAVNKAIQGDERFQHKDAASYNRPCCIDVTTPNEEGHHHAIISTTKGELVRHGFDYDKDEGVATMHDGDSTPTERTSIYAREVERHEAMVKATEEVISCRDNGIKLTASEKWEAGKPVSYIYVPGGVTTISAGFRKNESITCTVVVDEQTPKDLQESFDYIAATQKQEPYADEDHESKKATLRFPTDKVEFTYGTLRGEEGVIVKGAEPTSYGAESVNGKVYTSWSPEFATDAEYSKAKCKKGHWTFPDGVRGSASNPARIVAVNFVTGALTNKPAFRNMPNVKARQAELAAESEEETIQASGTSEGVRKAWETRQHGISDEAHKNQYQLKLKTLKIPNFIVPPKTEDHETHNINVHNAGAFKRKAVEAYDAQSFKTAHYLIDMAHNHVIAALGKVKSTESESSGDAVLDTIFARHEREVAEAEAFANKSAEAQARMREDAKTLDQTVESIIARNRERESFEDVLLARNPELKNRETIDAIANRKK